jgi:hypothetical protein
MPTIIISVDGTVVERPLIKLGGMLTCALEPRRAISGSPNRAENTANEVTLSNLVSWLLSASASAGCLAVQTASPSGYRSLSHNRVR